MIDKILLGIGAAIALIVAVALIWLSLANAHLRSELAASQSSMTAFRLANGEFLDAAEKQNHALALLNQQNETRRKKAEQAAKAAQKTAASLQKQATRIEQEKISGEDCKAAADLLNRYAAGTR